MQLHVLKGGYKATNNVLCVTNQILPRVSPFTK